MTTSTMTTDHGTMERNKQLLQGVQYLWEAGLLSDVTLETEDGHRFPAHRVALAAVSDYFMAMFTQDMQERLSNTSSICLKGVRGQVLEVLLRYVYTGKLRLLQGTVAEVASAAGYLQLECALMNCFQFAMTAIDIGNCVEIYNMAKMYKIRVGDIGDVLEEKTLQFICVQFQQVLSSGMYHTLDSDTINKCLTLKDEDGVDNLNFGPEFELFQQMASWCSLNDKAGRLLREIRFPLMTSSELDIVQNVVRSEGFQCDDLIKEAQNCVRLPMLNKVNHHLERYKVRNRPCIVTLAHDGSYKNLRLFILSNAEGCPPPAEQKKTLTWMQVPQLNQGLHGDMAASGFKPHSWAVLNGFLVVHGEIQPGYYRCFIFDPRTLQWETMPAMNVSRMHCPLVECCGELFAMGGVSLELGGKISGVIEKFSFETCQWSVIGQMEVLLEGHGACSVSDRIYVFGGRRANGRSSHATYSYAPGLGTWTEHHSLSALPKNNSLQLHSLLSRIYSRESSAWGMTHFQQPQNDPKASPTQGKRHCSTTKSHFAVVLPDSVYFIGASLPEVNRRERRNAHKNSNVNKCVQVIAKEKYGLGDSVPQPDYPKGWQPCLAVGLSLSWDIVRQAHPWV